MIHSLKAQGYSIRAIARMSGLNRRTVSKRLKEETLKPYKKRNLKANLMITKNISKKEFNRHFLIGFHQL